MNVENIIKSIHQEDGLSRTLGMEFISTPEDNTLKARMAVDDRNKQPFGFLAGGASLALAENLAGVGSAQEMTEYQNRTGEASWR